MSESAAKVEVVHKSTEPCPVKRCELDEFDYSQPVPGEPGAGYVVPERRHQPIHVDHHLRRCPNCTYSWPEWDGRRASFGCEECRNTGRARFWSATGTLRGGHYEVVIRCGRPGARANLGTVTMDIDDWADFQHQMGSSPIWDVIEVPA